MLVIDATEGITEQDAKIAGIAHDRGRGMIIVVNKWDAIEKDNNSSKSTQEIRKVLSFRRTQRSYLFRQDRTETAKAL